MTSASTTTRPSSSWRPEPSRSTWATVPTPIRRPPSPSWGDRCECCSALSAERGTRSRWCRSPTRCVRRATTSPSPGTSATCRPWRPGDFAPSRPTGGSGGPPPGGRLPLIEPSQQNEDRVIREYYLGEVPRRRAPGYADLYARWRPDVVVRDEMDILSLIHISEP